ncbi:MAG: class I SAM-dependent methyltransferase [Pseudomonadota bacterium]
MPNYDLDNAYDIDGPDSARRLYGDWAETYDDSFGAGWGYVAPRRIAEIYLAEGGDTPILDIGAGTGLVAEYLGGATVDAFDITPEMLEVARGKGIYRELIEGDLLKPLNLADAAYGGVISCGTFTHGHVGPACLPELLRVTRPGALFVCGTIPAVLDGMGFGSALAQLQAAGRITPLRFVEIEIYEGADHPHAADRGLVMVFRRA